MIPIYLNSFEVTSARNAHRRFLLTSAPTLLHCEDDPMRGFFALNGIYRCTIISGGLSC